MEIKENEGIELERLEWLTLKLIPELGNRSLLRLLKYFGSPSAILRAGRQDLAAVPSIGERVRDAVDRKSTLRPPEREWQALREQSIFLVCLNDPDYPANLAAIPDPPAVLFVRGSIQPRDLVSIAVVGSRAASPMGMAFTEKLCAELAGYGVTVVSGFAVGIDSAAHRGTLRGKGRTLAVLGCGLDVEYPRGSNRLKETIAESGAVMTEFPLGTPPAPGHFPMRNRIISGLSLGVVIVEAAQRSGSLITARLALEQGREVFAVPGTAGHHRSVGPHRLLREGAKLVETAEDIVEEIRPLIRPSSGFALQVVPSAPPPPVTPQEAEVLKQLDQNPQHMDLICRSLRWPAAQVMAALLSLELKGLVRQLPGKHFIVSGGS
ncbi:MAG: DNA-protecting protein DprA [Deltaproteobacteria bacterium]|nr:DNA-protecting protein DprA [Deltaproteobacteria bacterium]